jgi:hypothetical protein
MRRFLRRWLTPLLLVLCGALPLARAQDISPKDVHPGFGGNGTPAPQQAPADATSDKVERPPPTLAFFAAVIALLVVMCVICAPSRKAESASAK